MVEIKAIETKYKGYRFRSRLEARWAVFFDTMGIRWEYEKEGYTLPNGYKYLPDFWIQSTRDMPYFGCFVEIKANKPTKEEREKLEMLAMGLDNGEEVFCFWGKPSEDDWHATVYQNGIDEKSGDIISESCWVVEGTFDLGELSFVDQKRINKSIRHRAYPPFGIDFFRIPFEIKKSILHKSFTAFTSARFEYGEGG